MVLHCPVGDGTYDDWEDRCPVCGRTLQDEPFSASQYGDSDAITWLVTAPNEPEAHLWANTLRALDIPVFMRSGGPGVGAWASASSFEQDLMVKERDLVRAHGVVRDLLGTSGPLRNVPRARRAAPRVNRAERRG